MFAISYVAIAYVATLLSSRGQAACIHEDAVPSTSFIQLPKNIHGRVQGLVEHGEDPAQEVLNVSTGRRNAAAKTDATEFCKEANKEAEFAQEPPMLLALKASLSDAERRFPAPGRKHTARPDACEGGAKTGCATALTASTTEEEPPPCWTGLLVSDLVMGGLGALTILGMYLLRNPANLLKINYLLRAPLPVLPSVPHDDDGDLDDWGCTPLHRAAATGALDKATKLLEQGANVDAREAWEETPLHIAATAGRVEICALLLGHGADIKARNADDESVLMLAAKAGHEATVEFLLDRGADAGGASEDDLPLMLVNAVARRMVSLVSA